jgi:hypothetical protein
MIRLLDLLNAGEEEGMIKGLGYPVLYLVALNPLSVQKHIQSVWIWDMSVIFTFLLKLGAPLLSNDLHAEPHALIADHTVWPCNEDLNVILVLAAKAAIVMFISLAHHFSLSAFRRTILPSNDAFLRARRLRM